MTDTPVMTSVKLPMTLIDQIRAIAKAHDRSVHAEVRWALNEYIQREAQATR